MQYTKSLTSWFPAQPQIPLPSLLPPFSCPTLFWGFYRATAPQCLWQSPLLFYTTPQTLAENYPGQKIRCRSLVRNLNHTLTPILLQVSSAVHLQGHRLPVHRKTSLRLTDSLAHTCTSCMLYTWMNGQITKKQVNKWVSAAGLPKYMTRF